MLVKELRGVIRNRYLIYKIMTHDGFSKKFHVIPNYFMEFEVLDCYFHHNEFADILDIYVKEGVVK